MGRDKMARNKLVALGTTLMVVGGVLLIAATILLSCNLYENKNAQQFSEEVLQRLPAMDIREPSGGGRSNGEVDLPLYITNPDIEMPAVEIDGYSYIGRIDISSLGLSLPVMSEWSYPQLKLSPCRYLGSAYQNNLVIAAHNYKSHFGNLKYLSCGDEVTFTDIDGNMFDYEVAEIEQLLPTDIDKLTNEDWALTLITCTLGGEYRVAVRCIAV